MNCDIYTERSDSLFCVSFLRLSSSPSQSDVQLTSPLSKHRLLIEGSNNSILVADDKVYIGCMGKTLGEWLETYQEVGEEKRYSAKEIKEYGQHLKYINHLIKKELI